MNNIKNICISISGGRTSAYMALHIMNSSKYKDYNKVLVFANTSLERIETINFLKNIQDYLQMKIYLVEGSYSLELGVGVKYNIVEFENLKMKGEVFDQCAKHKSKGRFKGLPFSEAPYCSSDLKSIIIKKFADEYFGKKNYLMAIGYRFEDMPKRITKEDIKLNINTHLYPLLTDFDRPIKEYEIYDFWKSMPFDLEIHSSLGNCALCWKKSDKIIIEAIRKGADYSIIQRLEKEHKSTMYRNKRSIDFYVNLSKLPSTEYINFDINNHSDDSCNCAGSI